MKSDSNHLYELVHTLTVSEKRYCSLYLKQNAGGTGTRYLQLFNYLNNEPAYNGNETMQHLGYSKKPNHYAVLKKQLYEQLLNALHQYALFTEPTQQMLRGIHQCSVLLKKDLFTQCEKRMAALWKETQAAESGIGQLQLLDLKMTLISRKKFRQTSEADLTQWYTDVSTAVAAIENTARYSYLSALIHKIQNEAGAQSIEMLPKMEKVINLPEFRNENLATTIQARIFYHESHGIFAFYKQELEKSLEHLGHVLALMEGSHLMNTFASGYRTALFNYLLTCTALKKYDLLLPGLQKLRGLPGLKAFKRFDKTELDAVVFWMGYTLEMNYFIETGRFAEAYQKISNIKAGIKTFSPNIAKQNRMMLQCIMAYVSFAMAKYHETLDHLAPVIQEQEKSLAAEVQLVARIMQLLSHFENGNKLLLESLVKSLQRSLRAKNEAAKVPMAIVSFINSSIRKPALQKQDWQQLQSKLKRLSANKPPQGISDLIDYKTWIKAHIKGVSFAEARRSVPSPH